jgi:DNA-directed RNA polymerase subunit K/omega
MKGNDSDLNDLGGHDLDLDEAVVGPITTTRPAVVEEGGPQVPKPHDRPADVDRKIRASVDRMLEDVKNPYETVIVAAQEARRINERRLKARSILNQTIEHVEEILPDVPFMPRPVEDEEPEVKPTSEALERLALGLLEYEVDGSVRQGPSYYGGEIDFPLVRTPDEEEAEGSAGNP